MQLIRLATEETSITLYPIVCMHIGSPQSDGKFIAEHIERIADDPNGYWIYMGDGGECALKESKGDVYTQTMSPGEQLEECVRLLKPIAEKGVFGIDGNHGRRIHKATGLNWDKELSARIGIPYLGVAGFLQLRVGADSKRGGSRYDIFVHHGKDSSSVIGGKVAAAKALETLVEADAVISAHSHIALDVPPTYRAVLPPTVRGADIEWRALHSYIAGSAYDSRSGYAEEKAYSPILPSYIAIEFTGHRDGNGEYAKSQNMRIWRKEV